MFRSLSNVSSMRSLEPRWWFDSPSIAGHIRIHCTCSCWMDLTGLLFVLVVPQGHLKPQDLNAPCCEVPLVDVVLVVDERVHLDDFFVAVLRFQFE